MFFGVDAQIEAWAATAQTLVDDQKRWLRQLHPTSHATVAAVAWIGYTTPSLVNVASMELAREGQSSLTSSLQGLRASRGDDQPYLTVLAHSYGSTAALLSLAEDDVSVDALAVVGSPGSPARSVDELHVGSVWVGAADWDPIPASGVFGSQPASRSYGAQLFSVAAATDPLTGKTLGGALTHNDYFAPGSMSLRNLALIGLGEGEWVVGPDHSRGDFARAFAHIR
jgi:pimeloyl-ACP methyl ester carboxylesterase